MARVTVEDCILKVPNRFDLVMLAAQRARDISAGARETVSRDNDKGPVVALREIAEETVDLGGLRDTLIRGLQRQVVFEDDDEEDEAELVLTSEGEVEVERAPMVASDEDEGESEDEEAEGPSYEDEPDADLEDR